MLKIPLMMTFFHQKTHGNPPSNTLLHQLTSSTMPAHPHHTLIGFWSFRTLFLFFDTSIGGFQDASVQETEGLAMNESKLVKMPLHGSQRV